MVYRVDITISPANLTDLTITNLDLPDIPPRTLEDFTVSGDVLTGALAYGDSTNVFKIESTGFVAQELTAQELNDSPAVVLVPSYEISKIVNNGNTYTLKDAYARQQIGMLTPIAKLLKYEYFDHTISDQSWLEADSFSWQDGTVYSEAYNHLVNDYNTAGSTITGPVGSYTITYRKCKDGHRIVLPDQETAVQNIYNESGVSWYYILDTTNQRFKLPRKKYHGEVIQRMTNENQWMILYDDGWCEQGGYLNPPSAVNSTVTLLRAYNDASYIVSTGCSYSSDANLYTPCVAVTKYDDSFSMHVSNVNYKPYWRTSGYSYMSVGDKQNLFLYFYVGQFSQTATEQTAGLNASLFNGKIDLDGNNAGFVHIISTYHSGSEYYRVYSDGWCEQGGYMARAAATTDVTYLKEFVDTNYNLQMSVRHTAAGTDGRPPLINSPTTTGFTASINTSYEGFYWKACGYIVVQ